jgi:Opioid growth factor receptor (OGFr) conserved region
LRPSDGARIVAFYEGSAPDDRGRFHDEILRFDDVQLEAVHDFVQWLFPLRERSGANPSAPVLDEPTIEAFHARAELRAALGRSLARMLAFYGFEWSGERIVKSASFAQRSGWLRSGDHNHLRLTRVLRSLRTLGQERAAQALFEALSEIYREECRTGRRRISARTFDFWSESLRAE